MEHSIALVTGASRGLGRNTALSIARRGGDVIFTYQSRADAALALVALAGDAVQEAKDTSDAVHLKAMNPFERKIVHDAVASPAVLNQGFTLTGSRGTASR